ncbi:MAG: XRE family transcriptional regulator [Eubacterium sp.]|nr:XRE family transcriptional regulator [Eubacterium sp.]
MSYAYDKIYLNQARNSLGLMLDFVVYDVEMDLSDYWERFIDSDVCRGFEIGSSRIVAGKSGIEMAYDVLGKEYWKIQREPVTYRSPEYWTGWAIAYYQWLTGIKFKDITDLVSIEEIKNLYFPYHEIDITGFCDKLDEIMDERKRKHEIINKGVKIMKKVREEYQKEKQ